MTGSVKRLLRPLVVPAQFWDSLRDRSTEQCLVWADYTRNTRRQFLRDTRAGATAVVATAVTVMTIGATALLVDHLWLVDQRDMLKNASDAASIASTAEMNRQIQLRPDISDADLKTLLEPIATRYARLNLMSLPPDRLQEALNTLNIEVVVDRGKETIDIAIAADMGGTLLSQHLPLFESYSGSTQVRTQSVAASITNPVEVVLAIDISESMTYGLATNRPPWIDSGDPTRLQIVKNAARRLVDILDPNDSNHVAVGVVPWTNAVRLDVSAADRWKLNGWARYPTHRVYAVPYYCKPSQRCTPPPPVESALPPSPPEAWRGCLSEHRMGAVGTRASLPIPDEWFTPPGENSFSQGYFHSSFGLSYECLDPLPPNFAYQSCYTTKIHNMQFKVPSQFPCYEMQQDLLPAIFPLSTDRARIEQTIDALSAVGPRTYSALGILWGQRLLMHSWNDVWGGGAHPADPEDPTTLRIRKAIVLLTDGEDTHCGRNNSSCENSGVGVFRTEACEAAKTAGTEIFVVAAMSEAYVSTALADALVDCSSQADNPDGKYVFLNNSTPEALQAAFADIANQLRVVRRIY